MTCRIKPRGARLRNWIGIHASRATLISKLVQIQAMDDVPARVKRRIANYIVRFEAFTPDEDEAHGPGSTYLVLWGHKGEASAGVKAEVSFEAAAEVGGHGFTAEAAAKVSGPKASIETKRTAYRLQIQEPAGVIRTQDTVITYTQTDVSWFNSKRKQR